MCSDYYVQAVMLGAVLLGFPMGAVAVFLLMGIKK